MILWRLRGYVDPEGEFAGSEVVCSIERLTSEEMHVSAAAAHQKAEALQAELLQQGWTAG